MSEELAIRLTALKVRADRSYAALARRIGSSSSALHRYCAGTAVPPDFQVLERMGRICGANRKELVELHRAWLMATASRRPARSQAPEPLPRSALRGRYWIAAAAVVAATAIVSIEAVRRAG